MFAFCYTGVENLEKEPVYQKTNKNASQVLFPLIEQMCEGVANKKYDLAFFADQ